MKIELNGPYPWSLCVCVPISIIEWFQVYFAQHYCNLKRQTCSSCTQVFGLLNGSPMVAALFINFTNLFPRSGMSYAIDHRVRHNKLEQPVNNGHMCLVSTINETTTANNAPTRSVVMQACPDPSIHPAPDIY